MTDLKYNPKISGRFRGYLPIIVDVETAGFNPKTDALLEIAVVSVILDEKNLIHPYQTYHAHVEPFEGANLDAAALAFNKIDPFHPFRFAKTEKQALESIFQSIWQAVKQSHCSRAILVGHNPFFDLGFLQAAVARNKINKSPFHQFTTFDTATLGGLVYGQTVLARAARASGMTWDDEEAHSALYDAKQTAELFCRMVNYWQHLRPFRFPYHKEKSKDIAESKKPESTSESESEPNHQD